MNSKRSTRAMITLLAVVLTLSICTPFVHAATPEKYADCTTNAQKIEWLKAEYGITDLFEWQVSYVGETGKATEAKALDNIEQAWRLIGTPSSKKIFNYWATNATTPLRFAVTLAPKESNGTFGYSGKSKIVFDLRADYKTGAVASVDTIVHETIHAWDFGILGNNGAKTIGNINGSYSGYTNANQYVTEYAAKQAKEDFAETCEEMIVNGGDKPCTVGKDTILYKKYVACYDLMLEHFGVNSNAVKRSAAFLGVQLPADTK